MTFASYIGCEHIDYACVNFWQENFHLPRGRLVGKSCLQITMRFRFLGLSSILRLLSFIFFFAQV